MTSNPLRIAFMGTPDFAVPALEALHTSGHNLVCVYTQPPRAKGRGREVTPSPVHIYAQEHAIPVHCPASLKNAEEQKIFQLHNLDLAVVAAYGLILPKAVLDAPKYGCINIHASLLPRWRGASPIQRAIWEGDSETGITLMQMDEGLDTGPIIESRAVAIRPTTTAATLHDELAALGGAMIQATVDRLAAKGKLESEMQVESEATYAPLLKKEDGRIDWKMTAVEIDRQVRALNPWPGTWTEYEGKKMKVLEASVLSPSPPNAPGLREEAGAILARDGHVACGQNARIQLLKIQPPNGKIMSFTDAMNGGMLKPGGRFS